MITFCGMKWFSPMRHVSHDGIEWIAVKPRGDMARRLRDGINRKKSEAWSRNKRQGD